MTDQQRFIELYRSFGIECVINPDSTGTFIYFSSDGCQQDTPTEGADDTGYYVEFDQDGKFRRHALERH